MQESDLLAMIDDYFAKAESQPFEMNVGPAPEPSPVQEEPAAPDNNTTVEEFDSPAEPSLALPASDQPPEVLAEQPVLPVQDDPLSVVPEPQQYEEVEVQHDAVESVDAPEVANILPDTMSSETEIDQLEQLYGTAEEVQSAEDNLADIGQQASGNAASPLPDAMPQHTVDLSDWSMELLTQRVSGAVFKSMNDAEGNMKSYVDSQIMQLSARERV